MEGENSVGGNDVEVKKEAENSVSSTSGENFEGNNVEGVGSQAENGPAEIEKEPDADSGVPDAEETSGEVADKPEEPGSTEQNAADSLGDEDVEMSEAAETVQGDSVVEAGIKELSLRENSEDAAASAAGGDTAAVDESVDADAVENAPVPKEENAAAVVKTENPISLEGTKDVPVSGSAENGEVIGKRKPGDGSNDEEAAKKAKTDEEPKPSDDGKASFENLNEEVKNQLKAACRTYMVRLMAKYDALGNIQRYQEVTKSVEAAKERQRKLTEELKSTQTLLERTRKEFKARNSGYCPVSTTTRSCSMRVTEAAIKSNLEKADTPGSGLQVIIPRPWNPDPTKAPAPGLVARKAGPIRPPPVHMASIATQHATPSENIPKPLPISGGNVVMPGTHMASPNCAIVTPFIQAPPKAPAASAPAPVPRPSAQGSDVDFVDLTGDDDEEEQVVVRPSASVPERPLRNRPRISDLPALPSPGREAVLQIPKLNLSLEITPQKCVKLSWCFKDKNSVAAPGKITHYEVYSLGVEDDGSIDGWEYVDKVENVKLPVVVTFAEHEGNSVLYFAVRAKQSIKVGNGGCMEKWSEFSNVVCTP